MTLILASRSATRRAMLTAAGVPFTAEAADVDEESVKASLLAEGVDPRGIADALAELKAIKLSRRFGRARNYSPGSRAAISRSWACRCCRCSTGCASGERCRHDPPRHGEGDYR